MKVKDLIKQLEDQNQNAEVFIAESRFDWIDVLVIKSQDIRTGDVELNINPEEE